MKKLIVVLMMISGFAFSQEKPKQVLTAFIKVEGNCEQCKKRIENSVDIKGVKTSEWNEKTHILKVIYRADKVTEQQIKEAIVKAGHDVEGSKATTTDYDKLPDCCKYRDKKCEVKK